MEMKDILSFLGIQEQQFMTIVPIVLGQYGNAYTALLSNEEYISLWQNLSGNIGVFIDRSSTSMV
jgi:hypothetical protein